MGTFSTILIIALVVTFIIFVISEILIVRNEKRENKKDAEEVQSIQETGRVVRMKPETPVVYLHKNRYAPSTKLVDNPVGQPRFHETIQPIDQTDEIITASLIASVVVEELVSEGYEVVQYEPEYQEESDVSKSYESSSSDSDWSSDSDDNACSSDSGSDD